jgi:formamidopyrimidine-DNA glycosylase
MPELPEVETIVRGLSHKIKGLRVESFKILLPTILRTGNVFLLRKLRGKSVTEVRRRGKMILIEFEDNLYLLFHLKMTGNLLFCPREDPCDKHVHFLLAFKGQEKEMRFRDVRKFGFVSCVLSSDVYLSDELRNLGPEPLEIGYLCFEEMLKKRKARIKSLLLDQNFIAGIGNIYADEILYEARIHPLTSTSLLKKKDIERLWNAMRKVLEKAIERRGSSIQDYRDEEGSQGTFQNFHQAYGREDLPCSRCGEKIKRLCLNSRSSFFCPNCQKFKESHP